MEAAAAELQQGLVAMADRRLMRVVLENLLGNAWKFTEKTPRARIVFGREMCKGVMTYFVRDNGAGFNMQYAQRLFQPFQRLHSESEFSGTGIGLSIAHRIIDRHGGRIWAEGEAGKGAIFRFTIPDA